MPKPESRNYNAWFNQDGSVDVMTGRTGRDCHVRRHVSAPSLNRLTSLLNHALIYPQNYSTVWTSGWGVAVRPPDHA